jgi:APA family basic amino acid/polyamine antiporter
MPASPALSPSPLHRILGVGFGLALTFGTMVGVGILRLPGTVAAALGSSGWVMAAWAIGGLYALMGAVAVAELAAMIPQTGGFRIYAARAFGQGVGFAVGWVDWLCSVAQLAYVCLTIITFIGALWAPVLAFPRLGSVAVLALFTAAQWSGLRLGSNITKVISAAVGLMLLVLIVACAFAPSAATEAPLPTAAVSLPLFSMAMVLAIAPAMRAIVTAYDGWYAPIYMVEENTDPGRSVPRAMIVGTGLVILAYLLINLAFLHVLPIHALSVSQLPAADAARIALPRGGGELVTVISLLTVLSLLNNILLAGTRVLYGIGRDGWLTTRAGVVSDGGTPRVALALTSVAVVAVILTGSFEQIVALAAVLFLLYYIAAFVAVFVLRARASTLHRPYKAHGHPVSTAIVLVGSIAFLVAAVADDPRSGAIAAVFLLACVPAYAWKSRRRQRDAAARA